MPRSVNHVASRARRKKILGLTRGYFGARKNVWTVAKNTWEKGLTYVAEGEITADDSLGTPKVFTGGLIDNSGQIYRFIAVKSTGEIVKGSTAKFCGIVTGRLMFSNSVGGTTHAVSLVGMFDLPENRK